MKKFDLKKWIIENKHKGDNKENTNNKSDIDLTYKGVYFHRLTKLKELEIEYSKIENLNIEIQGINFKSLFNIQN